MHASAASAELEYVRTRQYALNQDASWHRRHHLPWAWWRVRALAPHHLCHTHVCCSHLAASAPNNISAAR